MRRRCAARPQFSDHWPDHPLGQAADGGRNRIATGSALFTKWQPAYDHRLLRAKNRVCKLGVRHWPNSGKVWPMAMQDTAAPNSARRTAGVVSLVELAGPGSAVGKTGLLLPAANVSGCASSGRILAQSVASSEGVVLSEGTGLSERVVLNQGGVPSEGVGLSEGTVLSAGVERGCCTQRSRQHQPGQQA